MGKLKRKQNEGRHRQTPTEREKNDTLTLLEVDGWKGTPETTEEKIGEGGRGMQVNGTERERDGEERQREAAGTMKERNPRQRQS